MSNTTIVIARYNEDIEWVKKLKINYLIYNKNKNSKIDNNNVIDIDNIGREEYCYLNYIISHYDSLPQRIIFCQAEFESHNPYFIELLDHIDNFNCIQPLTSYYNNRIPQPILKEFSFPYLNINGYPIHVDFFNNNLKRYYKPFDRFLSLGCNHVYHHLSRLFKSKDIRSNLFKILNLEIRNFENIEMTPNCYAAIFSVTKDVILQYPKKYYEELLVLNKQLAEIYPIYFGWIMELMWLELFRYDPPPELYKK